jgi:hypothetical protein
MSHPYSEDPNDHIEYLCEDIEDLERELAQAKAVIAEQKEVIERVTKHSTNRLIGLCKCGVERNDQAALINTLAGSLETMLNGVGDYTAIRDAARAALAAYELWRESK